MSSVVNKGLKVDIFPDKAMEHVLNQNMGNARFIWNNILKRYNELYRLFKSHGYPLNPNIRNLNAILKMLKQENSFLREGESTSQQQVFRDLNKIHSQISSKEHTTILNSNLRKTLNNPLEFKKKRQQHTNNQ